MKKFVSRIIMFFLIIAVVLSAIAVFDYKVIGSQYKFNYMASLVDKVERLESLNEPKIILVGNSNLSFGINSEIIEKELNMPVVNLGLHGGLGNAYHEEIAKLNIGEGDLVIVCHTSFSDDDSILDAELAWLTYDYNNQLFPIFRRKDYKNLLAAYPTYLRKSILLWLTGEGNQNQKDCYSRTSFNECGDVAYKPEEEQLDVDSLFKANEVTVPEINDICINRLNALNQYCDEHGATMVVGGYPIAYGKYTEFSEEEFNEFEMNLRNALDCDVISHYADYFYPYVYFYNTTLHLNDEGTKARTLQLISDIKNWKMKSKINNE